MAKLVKCKTCEKEIAKGARKCPHCGQSNPTVNLKKGFFGCLGFLLLFVVLTAFIGFIGGNKENSKQTESSVQTENDDGDYQAEVIKQTEGKRWYEGGLLHQKTIRDWKIAHPRNRLATAADFLYNGSEQFKAVATKNINAKELKTVASALVDCIDEAHKDTTAYDNQNTAEAATICMSFMGLLQTAPPQ
jgi:hypothetical protein